VSNTKTQYAILRIIRQLVKQYQVIVKGSLQTQHPDTVLTPPDIIPNSNPEIYMLEPLAPFRDPRYLECLRSLTESETTNVSQWATSLYVSYVKPYLACFLSEERPPSPPLAYAEFRSSEDADAPLS
jgi:hypothetical protein